MIPGAPPATLRLSGIVPESVVDGPGIRFVVFTQGCPHRCPGCHNPATHDPAGGYEASSAALASALRSAREANPLLTGVTVSGGEPFMQPGALLPFVREARALELDVWLYSGYRLEEIAARNDDDALSLLSSCDTLVDGRFEVSLRSPEAPFRGSLNQRIIQNPGAYIRTR